MPIGAPSEKEIEEARRVFRDAQDPKAKGRAVLANMKYWLETQGNAKQYPKMLESTMAAKGEERFDYLVDFLALSTKDKKEKKELQQRTKRVVGTKKRHHHIAGWKHYEQAKNLIGEKKLHKMIDPTPSV